MTLHRSTTGMAAQQFNNDDDNIEAMSKSLQDLKLHPEGPPLCYTALSAPAPSKSPPNNMVKVAQTAPSASSNVLAAGQCLDKEEEGLRHHVVMVPYPLQGHINPMVQFAKSLIAHHRPHMLVTIVNTKHNHERIYQHNMRSKLSMPSAAEHPHSDCTTQTGTPYMPQHHSSMSHDHKLHRTGQLSESTSTQCAENLLQFLWLEDCLPPDFDYTNVTPRLLELHLAIANMQGPLRQLLQSLNQKRPPISCVVFGSFCPWVHTVCAELGIPNVSFWTQSASVLSMYCHFPLLATNGFFPYRKAALSAGSNTACNEDHVRGCSMNIAPQAKPSSEMVSYVPGVPPLHPSSFPTLLHIDDPSHPPFQPIIREQLAILHRCHGIIINSFEELEKDAHRALQAHLPFPVSLVGPLIPSAFLSTEGGDKTVADVGASLLEERMECVAWLDRQKKRSVLYVSFGSLFLPSAEDLQSIACGIQASEQPFLWVIRPTSSMLNVADMLPEGFVDNTKDRGLIIPWAPQLQVLSHPSVGAFLSHCGWNSTLESVSMGVPMIPFPLRSDQPSNCAFVCDVWRVGMPLKMHVEEKVSSRDVERVVRTVLKEGSVEVEEMRKRACQLKEAAKRAVQLRSRIRIHDFLRTGTPRGSDDHNIQENRHEELGQLVNGQ